MRSLEDFVTSRREKQRGKEGGVTFPPDVYAFEKELSGQASGPHRGEQ